MTGATVAVTAEARRWWVYLIINAKGRSYVGVTFDVNPERRLGEHNGTSAKAARSTRGQGPWALAYAEAAEDRATALSREWHLKRDRGLRRRLGQNFTAAQT